MVIFKSEIQPFMIGSSIALIIPNKIAKEYLTDSDTCVLTYDGKKIIITKK